MSAADRKDARGSVLENQRGAILLGAVFMATFLVGCLWYVMGVGDAIIYREKMQDGADSVAFAAAVYHARGMNVIAMLNLVMAATLAVLIWLKIAQLLLITLIAILTGLCYFSGWACAALAPATTAENAVSNAIETVEPIVENTLKALSKLQAWIARATPYVASGRSIAAAERYGPTVDYGVAISPSMVPSDTRLGLPVEEDSFSNLCGKAGEVSVMISPLGALKGLGVPATDLIAGMVGGLTSSFPGYFCGGGGASDFAANSGTLIEKVCKQQHDQADEDDDFDLDKCIDESKKQLEKSGDVSQLSGDGKTSKRIADGSRNGDGSFQVYSFVRGKEWYKDSEKGVEIASWKGDKAGGGVFSALAGIGFAQSEFYYDQTRPDRLDWEDYEDDAMWNMRWRARLRRVRLPGGGLIGGLLGSGLPSWIPGVPQDAADMGTKIADVLEQSGGDQILNDALSNTPLDEGPVGDFVGAAGAAKVIH
jgi:hypothetical protein